MIKFLTALTLFSIYLIIGVIFAMFDMIRTWIKEGFGMPDFIYFFLMVIGWPNIAWYRFKRHK